MVRKIWYSSIANIVDYFKKIHTLTGAIECNFMVTQIALNIGCPEMAHVSYIEGDVSILGLDHFLCAHILREEPNYSISILYEGDSNAIRLPNPVLALYFCQQLTLHLAQMGNARHSYSGPPHT
jgi:hypothetical protein